MTPLTTIIVTAFASGTVWLPLVWALKARMDQRRPRWPQRVCGRLYDGGGIGTVRVTVADDDRIWAAADRASYVTVAEAEALQK